MLVLLDCRTWTSGDDTARFVEHIHAAMEFGVHITCVHEFPAVVGPRRHECEFGLMFGEDWTPPHLTGGKTNLYKEIALALKGAEWRQPGFVAFASKVAASTSGHKPVDVLVPESYRPKHGPNKWKNEQMVERVEQVLKLFDTNHDFIVSPTELHELLERVDENASMAQAYEMYDNLLKSGFDHNGDGQVTVEEFAAFWADTMTPTELETLSKANVTAMDPKELVTLLRRTSLAAQPGLSVLSQEVAPTTIAVAPDALKDASDRLMVMPPPAAQSAAYNFGSAAYTETMPEPDDIGQMSWRSGPAGQVSLPLGPIALPSGQIALPPGQLVEEVMEYNSRGSLVLDADDVFLTAALPRPQAAPAAEKPAQPTAAAAPAASLSDRLKSLLFTADQFGPAAQDDSLHA